MGLRTIRASIIGSSWCGHLEAADRLAWRNWDQSFATAKWNTIYLYTVAFWWDDEELLVVVRVCEQLNRLWWMKALQVLLPGTKRQTICRSDHRNHRNVGLSCIWLRHFTRREIGGCKKIPKNGVNEQPPCRYRSLVECTCSFFIRRAFGVHLKCFKCATRVKRTLYFRHLTNNMYFTPFSALFSTSLHPHSSMNGKIVIRNEILASLWIN